MQRGGAVRSPAKYAGAEKAGCLSLSVGLTHKKIDEAVFAAYGWNSDLSDEEILEKLLALSLERAKQ